MVDLENQLERPKDTFSIQNFYRPGDVYERLVRDHRSQIVMLENNLEDIVEKGYDPIETACVFALGRVVLGATERNIPFITDYLDRHGVKPEELRLYMQEEFTREDKIFPLFGMIFMSRASSLSNLASKIDSSEEIRQRFLIALKDQGLVFRWVVSDETESTNIRGHFQSEQRGFDTHIEVGHHTRRGEYTDFVIYPWSQVRDLNSLDAFTRYYIEFFTIFEKTIRAIYMQGEKDLPPTKLIFKPNPKETPAENPFNISCEYCNGSYKSSFDACTHCGAPRPTLL